MTRHFRTLLDFEPEVLLRVLARAHSLKALRGNPQHPAPLAGKSVGVLLEKASTRTRVSFEVGITELGGKPVVLEAHDLQLGRGESIEDTAKVLSRYLHALVYRAYGHDKVEALAANADVPVINGLSDMFHPCQLLADLMTVRENFGPDLNGVKVAWVGDGNNVAHSWINAAGLLGLDLRLACPQGYAPDAKVLKAAQQLGRGSVRVVHSAAEAVQGVQVVTTDVWASMGQEAEAAKRKQAFAEYNVTETLMREAAPDAIFLHCLPAHRGEEVAAVVIDGPQSRVWDEAENRLHAQKALLEELLA